MKGGCSWWFSGGWGYKIGYWKDFGKREDDGWYFGGKGLGIGGKICEMNRGGLGWGGKSGGVGRGLDSGGMVCGCKWGREMGGGGIVGKICVGGFWWIKEWGFKGLIFWYCNKKGV